MGRAPFVPSRVVTSLLSIFIILVVSWCNIALIHYITYLFHGVILYYSGGTSCLTLLV